MAIVDLSKYLSSNFAKTDWSQKCFALVLIIFYVLQLSQVITKCCQFSPLPFILLTSLKSATVTMLVINTVNKSDVIHKLLCVMTT